MWTYGKAPISHSLYQLPLAVSWEVSMTGFSRSGFAGCKDNTIHVNSYTNVVKDQHVLLHMVIKFKINEPRMGVSEKNYN